MRYKRIYSCWYYGTCAGTCVGTSVGTSTGTCDATTHNLNIIQQIIQTSLKHHEHRTKISLKHNWNTIQVLLKHKQIIAQTAQKYIIQTSLTYHQHIVVIVFVALACNG